MQAEFNAIFEASDINNDNALNYDEYLEFCK